MAPPRSRPTRSIAAPVSAHLVDHRVDELVQQARQRMADPRPAAAHPPAVLAAATTTTTAPEPPSEGEAARRAPRKGVEERHRQARAGADIAEVGRVRACGEHGDAGPGLPARRARHRLAAAH